MIVGLDVGTARCGIAVIDRSKNIVFACVTKPGIALLEKIQEIVENFRGDENEEVVFVFEVPTPYGTTPTTILALSANIVVTALHLIQKYKCNVAFALRQRIKYLLLGTTKAKDKTVRDYLMFKWNLDNKKAKSVGLKQDAWAALAAATVYMDALYSKEGRYIPNELEAMWHNVCKIWLEESNDSDKDDADEFRQLIEGDESEKQ
ncbi:MAG: hypothetical protein QXT58_02145 [Archaeoglobaceae archaeon]